MNRAKNGKAQQGRLQRDDHCRLAEIYTRELGGEEAQGHYGRNDEGPGRLVECFGICRHCTSLSEPLVDCQTPLVISSIQAIVITHLRLHMIEARHAHSRT